MTVYVRERRDKAVLNAEEVLSVKHVQACCLRTKKDRESPPWSSCLARASLFMCVKGLTKPFSPLYRSCEAGASLFKCQERSRKQFSPLLRSCEARSSLFMYVKGLTKPL